MAALSCLGGALATRKVAWIREGLAAQVRRCCAAARKRVTRSGYGERDTLVPANKVAS